MRRLLAIILGSILLLGTASMAVAASYDPTMPQFVFGDELGFNARAIGLGGAYVAVADDGTAAYWNPAGVSQIKIIGLTPSITLNGDLKLPPLSIDNVLKDGWPPNLGDLGIELGGLVGLNIKNMGLTVILQGFGDTTYNDDNTIDTSNVNAKLCGAAMFTYAMDFTDLFAIGANAKLILGKSLYVQATGDPGNPTTWGGGYTLGDAFGYAVDGGILVKLKKMVRIGLAVRNFGQVNWDYQDYNPDQTPKDTTVLTNYSEKLDPIISLGVAIKPPVIGTLVSAQIDKSMNSDALTYRIGIEQPILVLKLRAGMVMNEAMERESLAAGLGLKLGPVSADLAVRAAADFSRASVLLTAGFAF